MVQPAAGVLALLWLIAAYAIVFGGMLAFKVRSFGAQAGSDARGSLRSDRTGCVARLRFGHAQPVRTLYFPTTVA